MTVRIDRRRAARVVGALAVALALAPSGAYADWHDFTKKVGGIWRGVKEEASLLPGTLYHLPGAYWQTASDGSQIRSLGNGLGRAAETTRQVAKETPGVLYHLPQAYWDTAVSGEQAASLVGGHQGFARGVTLDLVNPEPMEWMQSTPERRRATEMGGAFGEALGQEVLIELGTAGLVKGSGFAINQARRGAVLGGRRLRQVSHFAPNPTAAHPRVPGKTWGQVAGKLDELRRLDSGPARPVPAEIADMPVQTVHPGDLKYSQSRVNYNVLDLEDSMRLDGWRGDPLDVVRAPDGSLVSIDNRRLVAANEVGLREVPVRIHDAGSPLPQDWVAPLADGKRNRFQGLQTFGEAVTDRTARQGQGFPEWGNYGTPEIKSGMPSRTRAAPVDLVDAPAWRRPVFETPGSHVWGLGVAGLHAADRWAPAGDARGESVHPAVLFGPAAAPVGGAVLSGDALSGAGETAALAR